MLKLRKIYKKEVEEIYKTEWKNNMGVFNKSRFIILENGKDSKPTYCNCVKENTANDQLGKLHFLISRNPVWVVPINSCKEIYLIEEE